MTEQDTIAVRTGAGAGAGRMRIIRMRMRMMMMMMAMMVDRKKERKKENRKGTKESFLSKNSFWVFFVKIRGIGFYIKKRRSWGLSHTPFSFFFLYFSLLKRGEENFVRWLKCSSSRYHSFTKGGFFLK